eukprot:TRINITY_DN16533_c0_g1_i1.p1 TRINITY_DN16533_c0_g1~~TRINITY_DN16533_c0_g1_i1.p1  ORF type:complete len:2187 (+),score=429.21 TRINITY_DN16533_c0_g1_i1:62-6562(+)
MATATTAALEAWVLAHADLERQALRASLVEGSEAWLELGILEALAAGRAAEPQTKELVERYQRSFPGESAQRLHLRREFLAASNAAEGSEEQKEQLRSLGQDVLHLQFSHATGALRRSHAGGGAKSAGSSAASPSRLDPSCLPSPAQVLEKLYDGRFDYSAGGLPVSCFRDLDLSRLNRDHLVRFLQVHRFQLCFLSDNPSFLAAILRHIKETRQGGTNWAPKNILDMMTLKQLDALVDIEPELRGDFNMITCLVSRKFWGKLDAESQALMSRSEKRESFLEALAFIDGCLPTTLQGDEPAIQRASGSPASLRICFIYEILKLGVELATFDKSLLLRYLKDRSRAGSPMQFEGIAFEGLGEQRQGLFHQPAVMAHLREFILEESFAEEVKSLVGGDRHALQELRECRHSRCLTSGGSLGQSEVDAAWLQQLSELCKVQILPHNATEFPPESEVRLFVRLKNVPRLTVCIYEINAENYYVENQKPFTSDINLEGVGASYEEEFTYSQAPVLEHDEELVFPRLAGRSGLFVLDLVGSGLRSRAVIRKGTLSLVHRTSPVGHVAYVLGPDRQVVREGARLYLSGRWYDSDAAKGGRIIIPYASQPSVQKVVISALGTAQFSDFMHAAESYELRVSFCLLPETVIMGQKAKLLVRPILFCGDRRCDPKLMRKAEIVISMRTGEEGIPVVRTFSDFDLGAETPTIEFLVPPRLKSLEANFSAEVMNHSKKTSQRLIQTKSWTVEDHSEENTCLCELYLACTLDGYEVRVLGKDGEPQKGVQCNVQVRSLLERDLPSLTTDEFGCIQLGQLRHVSSVSVAASGLFRTWQLLPAGGRLGLSLPDQVDALVGEEVRLPCPHAYSSLEPHLVSLTKVCGPSMSWPAANRLDALSLEDASSSGGSTLLIRGLERGQYTLQMAGEAGEPMAAVEVHIHEGDRWQSSEYVLRKDAILENRDRPSVLTIASAAATRTKVSARIEGGSPQTRVHVFAFNFLPPKLPQILAEFEAASKEPYNLARFPFQQWRNLYQSDVSLGSESSYVLRRRKMASQVGNLLEKPQLLLQPRELRATSFDQENLKSAGMMDSMQEKSYACAPRAAPCMMQQACCVGGNMMNKRRIATAAGPPRKAHRPQADISAFQNFLRSEPYTAFNLRPSHDGTVDIEVDLEAYSSVLVLTTDDRSLAHRLLALTPRAEAAPASRGLALQAALDANLACVERRVARALLPGDSFDLADQASAEWRCVDSVERLLAFIRAVQPELAGPLEELGLGTWSSRDRADKLELWSKHACHELNLFLYFKDKDFFVDVVKPFLQSKMEQDVVDGFLLEDKAAMKPMLSAARFQMLNPLEQVLVLRVFGRELPEECGRLAQVLGAQVEAENKQKGTAHHNALLDSVLSLEPAASVDEWAMPEEIAMPMACEARSAPRMRMARRCVAVNSEEEEADEYRAAPDEMMSYAAAAPMAPFADFGADEVSAVMRSREPEPFKEPTTTKEYAETTYKQGFASFGLNGFWAHAAKHALSSEGTQFLSPDFVYATSCLTEAAGALALMDLPFAAAEHSLMTKEGLSASFLAQSPCVFVVREIIGVQAPSDTAARDLLVTVRVFKARESEESSQDPRAVKEFLVNEPYCLQVVVTNVSPKNISCQLLVQVPQGSLPLGPASYTRAYPQRLGAFACCRVAVHFYFPRQGDFAGAPVCCSVDGAVVATSGGVSYHVVTEPSQIEVRTFADVLGAGESAVVAFLKERDLVGEELNFTFDQLYPLLGSKSFYLDAVAALRGRGIFERTVWGYAFHHGDVEACREFLQAEDGVHKQLGPFFESSLVQVSAAQADFKHLDYYPLVNKRVHRIEESGAAPPILNAQLRATYEAFLRALAGKPQPLGPEDRLRISYYLLCQDRVAEAAAQFDSVRDATMTVSGSLKLQRAYMSAYLDLFDVGGKLSTAREVAQVYADCPHTAWRERFQALAQVLKEIDTGSGAVAETQVATAEAPSLQAEVRPGGRLEIQARGLAQIRVRFYKVDLEMLFSRTPFLGQGLAQPEFSFVKPIFEGSIPGDSTSWEIPSEHRASDLAVELSGGSPPLKVFTMHFAATLTVAVAEQHGYLTATNAEGRPLPSVYVKVFARDGGREQFFKDGYTDLRGRFDYASLSGESISGVQRFAILVASKEGGLVREAHPPRTGR